MPGGGWIISISGTSLALAGLLVMLWSLLADRLRTRPLRKEGKLRRCPKCWYDMSAVAGLTCPECGRTVKRERSLTRPRRRWRWAALAGVLLCIGAGSFLWRHVPPQFWIRRLPDTVLIELIPHAGRRDWAAQEMFRRLCGDHPCPLVEPPHRLSAWQRGRLSATCTRAIEQWRWGGRSIAWVLLTYESARPEFAVDAALAALDSPAHSTAYQAYNYFRRTGARLERSRLELARDKLVAMKTSTDATFAMYGEEGSAALRAMLDARLDAAHQQALAAVNGIDLSPDGICTALGRCSAPEACELYERLGLGPPPFAWGSSTPTEHLIEIRRHDIQIDGDATTDCLLEVKHSEAVCGEFLAFARRGSGWRFLGCISDTNWSEQPAQITSHAGANGQRWLRITHANLHWLGGMEIQETFDAWYRCISGRLELVQWVTTTADRHHTLDCRLRTGPPAIERVGRRHFAAYDVTTDVELPGSFGEAPIHVGGESGRFLFPLDRVPAARPGPYSPWARFSRGYGRHRGLGPWQGREYAWLLESDDEAIIERFLPRLLELARTGGEDCREQLRFFTAGLTQTEAVVQLDRALGVP